MRPMTVALHKALLSRPTPTLFTTSRVCRTTSRLQDHVASPPFKYLFRSSFPGTCSAADRLGTRFSVRPLSHITTQVQGIPSLTHRDCCALSNLTFLSPSDDV